MRTEVCGHLIILSLCCWLKITFQIHFLFSIKIARIILGRLSDFRGVAVESCVHSATGVALVLHKEAPVHPVFQFIPKIPDLCTEASSSWNMIRF